MGKCVHAKRVIWISFALILIIFVCAIFSGCGTTKRTTSGNTYSDESNVVTSESTDYNEEQTNNKEVDASAEQDLEESVLDALKRYKEGTMASWYAGLLNDYYISAGKKLGEDSALYDLLYCCINYGILGENDTVLDVSITILELDKLSEGYIGNSKWLIMYDDFDTVYPVCNLQSGLYGMYNTETEEYLYEPSFIYFSEPDDEGYICVCYQGYYGCINKNGEKVVGFMYDEPISYSHDVAVVKTNDKYGVVDRSGAEVLPTSYTSISIYDSLIGADIHYVHERFSEIALFSFEGVQLSEHIYTEITYKTLSDDGEPIVFARFNDDNTKTGSYDWYDLYSYGGVHLIGEDSDLPDIAGVLEPDDWGMMVAECQGNVTTQYGYEYPDKQLYSTYYCYVYLTPELEYFNDHYYSGINFYEGLITSFNGKGYAIASVYVPDDTYYHHYHVDARAILDINLGEIEVFYMLDGRWLPCDANDYVYLMDNIYYDNDYELYIRSTGEGFSYGSIRLIDGTNLTIVTDEDSGLYGLYDQDTLVLDTVYNSITYSKSSNTITATRGAETYTYNPVDY